MKNQIPNWLFAVIVAAAVLGALLVLGKMTPQTEVAAPGSALVGQTVADFSGEMADGKAFRLSDYKGQVVLVNFWATWCGPCLMEIPDLIKLQEKYGPRGFTVVGLSEDEMQETAAAFAKEKRLNYPVVMVTPEMKKAFGGVPALPASFLLDRSGKIIWAMEGVDPDKTPESIISPEIEKVL